MSTSTDNPRSDYISSKDHGAYIVVAAALLLIWTVLVFSMRVYIRFRMNPSTSHGNTGFSLDDIAYTVGTVIATGQTSTVLAAVHYGMGKRKDLVISSQREEIIQIAYAASLLYIIAICASKCSTSLLIARLTPLKNHHLASHSLTFLTIAWGAASILVIAFACSLPQAWNTQAANRCSHLYLRWVIIEGISMFIEVSLFALALYFAWDVHMSRKSKTVVVSAFSCRLLIIIPTAFRLLYLPKALDGPDPLFDGVYSIIATQVVMHYSLMASTIPYIKPFLRAFDNSFGYSFTAHNSHHGMDLGYAQDGSYILHSIDKEVAKPTQSRIRSERVGNESVAEHYPQRRITGRQGSSQGNEPTKMFIRKTQEVHITSSEKDPETPPDLPGLAVTG